ncbi:MAG: potassium channel family protein, partial [Candidatus Korobacteraceae bacterium]
MASVKPYLNLKILFVALVALVLIGMAGFHFLEGWSWFEGFYMVLTTITTIGYGEVHPLSHTGRIFNTFIIIAGVGLYIICGAGRVGRSVARELARKPCPFVIVDNDVNKLASNADEGWLTLVGDATQTAVLRQAHIERARGLVASTTTDATNIYIILTSRSLNPKLEIIARASEEEAEKHLLTAGANHVVSPYNFAGYRIAQTFMRPHV